MNREILFRGKRLDNGEWAYGYLEKRPSAIQGPDYGGPWYIWTPPVDPDDSGGYYNVDPATVGQYTGLMDKIGKKIFGGDIVTTPKYGVDNGKGQNYSGKDKFVVGYSDGTYTLENGRRKFCLRPDIDAAVCGNIYDNPELLEVKR